MRLFATLAILAALLAALPGPAGDALAQGGKPGAAAPAPAVEEGTGLKLERWDAEAKVIEDVIAGGDFDAASVEGMRATLDAQRSDIAKLSAASQSELGPLLRQRDALGAPPEGEAAEAPEIAAQRTQLGERIAAAEAQSKRLAQADARAAALLDKLSVLRRQLFTRELLTRGPSIFEPGVVGRAFAAFRRGAEAIRAESAARLDRHETDLPYVARAFLTVALIGVAMFLAFGVRRAALHRLLRPTGTPSSQGRRVLTSIGVTLVRLLVPAVSVELMLLAVWNSGMLGPMGESLLYGLGATVLVVTGAYALGGAYYSPHAPELRLSALPEADAVAAHRWLMVLAAVIGLDGMLIGRGEAADRAIEWLQVTNTVLLVAGGIVVWGYARYIADGPAPDHAPPVAAGPAVGPSEEELEPSERRGEFALAPMLRSWGRVLAHVIAVVAPLLAALGYYAASRFIFYPVVFSGAVIGLCVMLFYAVHDTVHSLVAPEAPTEEKAPSRIHLIPVIVGFLLICATIPVLALIWGADLADIGRAWRAFSYGFQVGEVTIAPLSFFSFLVVFSVGYLLTRLVQRLLSVSVLPLTGLDSGGRGAITAGVFYIGVFLSALIAISTTGLDLSNIAIVAGALSVGIGFGLQNIVNNFISGIILLMERPIKAGDWVELGSGMGYVKQINVRSTEIETFDRASLIVPNSELISGPVTNRTHHNRDGRLAVPIGVAYGTDPRKVEQILLEIVRGHPMLHRRPAPFVLFRRFGPDALEFEIRGILRDVNWILNVTSEINYEIARRFAEAGIEIPFAQRDLHLRNAGELGRSIGEAVRGAGPQSDGEGEKAAPAKRRRRRPTEAAGEDPDGDT